MAYQLSTIYGPLVTDLEEPLAHGATINEMRQVRTALKKFFQYLNEQGVLSDDDLQKDKEELRYQLVDQSMEEHNIWDNLDFASFFNPPQLTLPLFDADTEQVLASYCAACANLYGVISCDQAYRIIMKQNPQLRWDRTAWPTGLRPTVATRRPPLLLTRLAATAQLSIRQFIARTCSRAC